MLKKINVLLLAVILAFGATMPAFAEETAAVAEDVAAVDADTAFAAELLGALGILDEDSSDDMQEQMTRAEFAVLACRFAGMFTPLMSDNIKLKDVLSNSLEEAYIYTAVSAGFMAPVNDGYFYPAWAIKSEEAAETLLMSMGYGDLAQQNSTFARFAGTLGLYDGIDGDGEFTRGEAYRMIFNALHADVMDQKEFGSVPKYTQLDGIDALYKFHKVVRTKGTVNGADGIVLGSGAGADLPKDCIELDGVRFYLYNYDTSALLGRSVWLYWYDDTSVKTKEVVSVRVLEDDSVILLSEDIEDYSNLTYRYDDGNKSESLVLKTPYVIYNGEEYTGAYSKTVMKPERGDVTIIREAAEDGSDLVIIRSYKDLPVKNVISEDYVVIGYNGENLNLDEHFDGVQYYTASGAATNFSKIAANTVLSYAQSATEEKTVVYISDVSVTGQLTQMDADNGEWTIGEEVYKTSKYLEALIEADTITEPNFRSTYVFYMNVDNEIVYYEETKATSLSNFYAIIAGAQEAEGLSDDISLKIFAKTIGGFEIYPCADRVTLNGRTVDKADIMEELKRNGRHAAKGAAFVAQAARVGLNADNEINFILQAGDKNIDDGLGFYLYFGSAIKKGQYRHYRDVFYFDDANGNDLDTTVYIPESGPRSHLGASNTTEYIQIPYFSEEVMNENDELVEVSSIDTGSEKAFVMASRPSGASPMFVYVEEPNSLVASFVVLATEAGERTHTGTTSQVRMIVDIKETVYEGEVVTTVKTNNKTYYLDNPNIDPDNLKIYDSDGNDTGRTHKVVPGDLVNLYVDSLGYIQAMEIVYSSEQKKMMGANPVGETLPGETETALDTWHTGSMWNSRSAENRIYLLHLYRIDNGYFMGTIAEPAVYEATLAKQQRGETLTREDRDNLRRYIGILPSATMMEDKRGSRTVRNATSADLISYEDSATDYVTLAVSVRYAQQSSAIIVQTR